MSTDANTTPEALAAPAATTPPANEPAPQTAETKAPEPKESARFAALTRKERAIVAKEQATKAELAKEREAAKAELAKERDALKADRTEFDQWKAKRDQLSKGKKLDAIKETFGWSYDDIFHELVPPNDPAQIVQREIEKLEAKHEEARKRQLQEEKDQLDQANVAQRQEFYRETTDAVKKLGDQYEFIAAYEAWDEVPAVFEEIVATQKRMPTFEEVAQIVEDFFEQKALKAAATKKFKAKASPQPTQEAPKQEATKPPQRKAPTLSNSLTLSQTGSKGRSREEARKRADAAFAAHRAKQTS